MGLSGPSSAVRGGVIGNLVSLRIRNNGPVDASIGFSVGFYISTDPVITTSDQLLIGGREFVAYLRAGQETPVPLYGGARVPTNSPIGNVFLGVIVDEFGAVVEGDETDNTAAMPIMITATGDVATKPKPEGRSLTSVIISGQECDCAFDGADGYGDLTLKFQTQDIVDALGPVAPGDVKVLTITGALLDGTPFEASDCVVIVGGKKDGQLTEQGRIGTVSVR